MEYVMSDTARTLFKGGTLVTMDAKVPNLVTGDILVEGDRIAAVEANISAGSIDHSGSRSDPKTGRKICTVLSPRSCRKTFEPVVQDIGGT
jgi:hypothetical protein